MDVQSFVTSSSVVDIIWSSLLPRSVERIFQMKITFSHCDCCVWTSVTILERQIYWDLFRGYWFSETQLTYNLIYMWFLLSVFAVGHSLNRTLVRFAVWRFVDRTGCRNDRCGNHHEHLGCDDELLRAVRWTTSEYVFVSKSVRWRIAAVRPRSGTDLTGRQHGSHIGHIQCD